MPGLESTLHAVLANGLTALIREDHKSPVAVSSVWFRVGSNYERPEVYGWSHGIEHMMFKGTSRRGPGDVAREVKDAGGELNAGTGHETTNYYIVIPSRNLDVAIDVQADALRHSLFDPAELDREREVLVEENNMRRDRHTGGGHTWEELLALAFTTAAYRLPIGGPDENLRGASREDIVRYRDTYYVAGNCAVVVVGDVDARTVLRRMEEAYGSWRGAVPRPRSAATEPPQQEFRYRCSSGDVRKVYLKMGYHSLGELHPDTFAIKVLAQVLGRGRSSRLVQEVLEKKRLVSAIHILEETGPDMGYWAVDAVTDVERLAEAQAAILEEFERVQVELVSPEEVEKARISIERDYALTCEAVEGQASWLGYYWAMGDWRAAASYVERIRKVTPEAIAEVARRYFGVEGCSVNVFHPQAAEGRIERDRECVARRLAGHLEGMRRGMRSAGTARDAGRPQTAAGGPAGERQVKGETVSEPTTVARKLLANGLSLITRHAEGSAVVALGAFVRGGSAYEGPDNNGITAVMQRVMAKGTHRRSAREIAERVERLGATLSPFYTADAAGCFVAVLRRNLAPAGELLAEILTDPTFPADEIERERQLVVAEIAALEDDPLRNTLLQFGRAVFGPHPYGLPTLGTRESVTALGREDLVGWYGRFYVPQNMVIAVVGDFRREELTTFLGSFDRLPAGGPAEGGARGACPPAEKTEKVIEKEVAQEVIVAGFPGPGATAEERYPMEVLESVLHGMGNRLFVALRDRQGLCYFTGFFYRAMREAGLLGAYIGTSPDKETAAIEGLVQELRRVTATPVSEAELARAKNTLIGNFALRQQTTSALAALYAGSELLGLGYDWAETYPGRIMAVTGEEVLAVARRWFDLDNYALVVTKPGARGGTKE